MRTGIARRRGTALDGERGRSAHTAERYGDPGGDVRSAGHLVQLVEDSAIERDPGGVVGIASARQGQGSGDDTAGLESGIDVLECREASQEESGAYQQKQGQG